MGLPLSNFPLDEAESATNIRHWGWPWHGLIIGGEVGDTTKVIAQPPTGISWLIDKSLPAIVRTEFEEQQDIDEGIEWRNYALLPAGTVNGVALGDNTYIHIDEDGVPFKVALSATFPSGNTCRVQASIARFGLLDQDVADAQTPITKTVDVACEYISLGYVYYPPPQGTGFLYDDREAVLQDVYTNGSKALLGVLMRDSTDSHWHVFSAIEISFTQPGGEDGSGLQMAASEIQGRSDLTTLYEYHVTGDGINTAIQRDIVANLVTMGDCTESTPPGTAYQRVDYSIGGGEWIIGNTNELGLNEEFKHRYCCCCCYDQDGNCMAIRLGYHSTYEIALTDGTGWTLNGSADYRYCPTGWVYTTSADFQAEVEKVYTQKWQILINDTVHDEVTFTNTQTDTYTRHAELNGFGSSPPAAAVVGDDQIDMGTMGSAVIPPNYIPRDPIGSHSIGSAFNWPLGWISTATMFDWRVEDVVQSWVYFNRRDHAVSMSWSDGTAKVHGDVWTPSGVVDASAYTDEYYIAWQRKTDQIEVRDYPIAWI